MPLTDVVIRNAKPRDKAYKLADGDGMYLMVQANGSKLWRMKYRHQGKEKSMAFGRYPEVSLSEAREKRFNARKLLSSGIDPMAQKKEAEQEEKARTENSFQNIGDEWLDKSSKKWTPDHAERVKRRIERNLYPKLGKRPIHDIKPSELLDAIRVVEKRGATELSHRVLQNASRIFRYAIATGKAEHNIAADLQGALEAYKETHYPTITIKELPEFITKLEAYETTQQNKLAIKILMHTFLRQGELRHGRWCDVDFDAQEWRIPAEFMKMKEEHIVPLASQTIDLLHELKEISGAGVYMFPSQNRQKHPVMSENTINSVLKRMGYKGKLVGHGFRALASTTLNEMGFRPDVIERQLAHAERNKVREAYNRAEYLPERRKMMQHWADYIQSLSDDSNVVTVNFGKVS